MTTIFKFASLLFAIILGGNAFVLEDTLNLSIGLELPATAVIKDNYAYFGTDTSPGYVVKVDLSNFTLAGYIQLNPGESKLLSSFVYDNYAYFGTDSFPGRIVKVNLTSFTRESSITLTTENEPIFSAVLSGSFGYFGTTSKIVKVDLSSFTKVSTLNINLRPTTAVSYLNYGFFGTTTGIIIKVDLNTLTVMGNITLNFDETTIKSSIVFGNSAYFGANYPGKIIQINLDTFTRVNTIALDNNIDEQAITAVVIGNYGYFGSSYSIKIDLSSFTRIPGSVPLRNDTAGKLPSSAIAYNGDIYYGMSTSPGEIIKVTGNATSSIYLDSFRCYLSASLVYGDYAYFAAGTEKLPNTIVKIDLKTFLPVASIDLDPQYRYFRAAFIDGNIAYFVDYNGNIFRINLSNFTLIGSPLNIGYPFPFTAFVSGYFGYFGADMHVVKVDLDNFSVVGNIPLQGYVYSSTVHDNYAYFSTFTTIEKVDLSLFSVVGMIGTTYFADTIFIVEDSAYFAISQSLLQVNLTNFTVVSSKTISQFGPSFIYNNNSLITGNSLGFIIEYDLNTFTEKNKTSYGYQFSSVVQYGNYSYFGTFTGPGTILKVTRIPK
jgi:hypothetical protein